MLNAKLAAAAPDMRILAQPSSEPIPELQQSWPNMGVEDPYADGLNYNSLEQQMAQMSWPPLDLGCMMRSPSPLTRMLWESPPMGQML